LDVVATDAARTRKKTMSHANTSSADAARASARRSAVAVNRRVLPSARQQAAVMAIPEGASEDIMGGQRFIFGVVIRNGSTFTAAVDFGGGFISAPVVLDGAAAFVAWMFANMTRRDAVNAIFGWEARYVD
jgi:hypothetical protein